MAGARAHPRAGRVALGGYKLLVPRGYELSVNFLGKAATWLLYAALAFVMVTHEGTEWPLWIFWIGLVLALAAARSMPSQRYGRCGR